MTGFLPTFLLSCVRAVLLVINCLLLIVVFNGYLPYELSRFRSRLVGEEESQAEISLLDDELS